MIEVGKGQGEGSKVTQFKVGHRKAGGRKIGTMNKVKANVREIAGRYVEDVIAALFCIAQDKDAPAVARVAACRELLDRYEGKPAQRIEQVIESRNSQRYNDIAGELRRQLIEE